jgi:hypothetical protein
MTEQNKIQITIKGAGLSYTKEISENVAAQIMALCLAPFESLPDAGKTAAPPSVRHSGGQRESAAEYMTRHAPKRKPDKILTLACFLKDAHNKDSFQAAEIKPLFRDAGELMPANFTRDFNWAVSSGWIAPDHVKKGSYFVTNTGLKVLQGGFPDELVKKSKNKAGGRRKKSKNCE